VRCAGLQAAKAAVIDFYETLRYEVKDDVGITMATHGWIGGEPGAGRFALEEGAASPDQPQAQQHLKVDAAALPAAAVLQVEAYARAVVDGACRGDARVRRPGWYDVFLVFRAFAPDVLAWTFRLLLSTAAPAPSAPLNAGGRAVLAPVGAPTAALPAPPVRPLIEYPATAAARRPAGAAAQLQKLE
jgi:hypothetical protein